MWIMELMWGKDILFAFYIYFSFAVVEGAEGELLKWVKSMLYAAKHIKLKEGKKQLCGIDFESGKAYGLVLQEIMW